MSEKELKALQLKRLKALVRYVYEKSPFYRRKFREAGITPEEIKSLDDLGKIPFTTKDDLRLYSYPYGGEFLCVPREELIGWHMTSGTTGKPTIGAYTFRDYETWMNLMARCLTTAGVRKGDILLNIYGYGLFTGGLGFHQSAHLVGAAVIPWSVGRTEAMIDIIKDYGPTVMTGTPSYQLYILELMNKRGIDTGELPLRITMPGAEMWTEEHRKKLEKGLKLREKGGGCRNIYGSTETLGPGTGVECEYEQGFHFWTDHFLLEVIDPQTGEHVSPGEEGEIVVTTLTKEAMPLLRYRMRDITKIDDSGCECGRNAFPRCMWITGRVDDMIYYKGAKVWPSAIHAALHKFDEIKEYQLIVTKSPYDSELLLKIELKDGADTPYLREEVVRELKRTLVFFTPRVEFVKEGTLPRYEGKAKRVVVQEVA
nr:phenylacetate-CoA ligase [uncultured crenarchaeote]